MEQEMEDLQIAFLRRHHQSDDDYTDEMDHATLRRAFYYKNVCLAVSQMVAMYITRD